MSSTGVETTYHHDKDSIELYKLDHDDDKEIKRLKSIQKCNSIIRQRLPVLKWLPNYKRNYFVSDLVAGFTVGLTVVPQSMGFAALATLSPEYGLYTAYIGCFLYILFGSCRQVTVGPVSLLSLLVFQTCGQNFPECAVWLSFHAGIAQILMACLQLGVIVSFISEPVTVGFTAGAAVTTISAQIRSFLGMSNISGTNIVKIWTQIFQNLHTVRTGDAVMGVSSFVALLFLQKIKDLEPPTSRNRMVWKKVFWYISVIRNALIVIITSVIAFLMRDPPFKLTGTVKGGLPSFHWPALTVPEFSSVANETLTEAPDMLDVKETWQKYTTAPVVVAIIGILQNVAISKAFGSGQSVDATQEMLTLGITNIVGGFCGAIPACGSFSRSAVNDASGVKTQLGGLFTAVLVLASLVFLTPSFYYIPKASLAAVIIAAVMSMIEYNAILPMWRISLFLSMELGIAIGVGISVASLLVQTLKPQVKPKLRVDVASGVKYLIVRPEHGLKFPSIDHLRTQVNKIIHRYESIKVLVIDLERWTTWDYTAINSLVALERGMKKAQVSIVFFHCDKEWKKALEAAGLKNPLCCGSAEQLSEMLLQGNVISSL